MLATDIPFDSLEAAIAETEPDVAVIDFGALRTPIQVHQLHEAQPETHIVIVVDRATPQECNQLLAFGATAILARDTQKRDILTAIHLASRGMHVLPGAGGAVDQEPYGPDLLTEREAEVLELLQQGLSNAEIAQKLRVGIETVRTHARNIYRKLGVTVAARPRRGAVHARALRGAHEPALVQHLGELDRVGGGALVEVVAHHPQVERALVRRVAAEAADEHLVAAGGGRARSGSRASPGRRRPRSRGSARSSSRSSLELERLAGLDVDRLSECE